MMKKLLKLMNIAMLMVPMMYAYGSLTRSNVGATHISYGEHAESPIYTASDYIQDGLIAMWDGIENIGHGEHDNNTDIWIDLVGGKELILNGATASEDHIRFMLGSSAYSNSTGLSTSNTQHGEICIDVQSPPVNRQYMQFAKSSYRIFANAYSNRGGISLCTAALGHGAWPSGKHTMSVYWPSNELHVDSILRETVTSSDTWSIRSKDTIIGDVNMTSTPMGFDGKVYCIRIYNRALSEEEISYNYNIDKVRFGL